MGMLIQSYMIQQVIPNVVPNFKILGAVVPENVLEKKKNGQIKKMRSMRMLILSYMIPVVVLNICTKFQNPRCSSS